MERPSLPVLPIVNGRARTTRGPICRRCDHSCSQLLCHKAPRASPDNHLILGKSVPSRHAPDIKPRETICPPILARWPGATSALERLPARHLASSGVRTWPCAAALSTSSRRRCSPPRAWRGRQFRQRRCGVPATSQRLPTPRLTPTPKHRTLSVTHAVREPPDRKIQDFGTHEQRFQQALPCQATLTRAATGCTVSCASRHSPESRA
jgi:hypothetical protein